MSKIFENLEVELNEDLAEKIAWLSPNYSDYRITRQSVDARKSRSPHFVYTVEVAEKGESLTTPEFEFDKVTSQVKDLPIIVGTGPAGLFAALRLVEYGIPCRIFERGSTSENRIKGINQFWRYGKLDPQNNVCFGEGGAGLYSDGKLITRIKSEHIPYVMNRLVKFGAPEEIQWLANPHVGSDKIRRLIPKLRNYLIENGCVFHFDSQVTKLIVEEKTVVGVETIKGDKFYSPYTVLATGHSATDMLEHLSDVGVFLEGKSFAMGLRIEHPQKLINKIQFREHAENSKLGAANYKLASHDKTSNVGVYSFCMCPGGYVLSSGTEADGIVCNGMSNYNRNSPHANAAIVVSVDHQKLFGTNIWGGMKLRRLTENKAFLAVKKSGGTRELPAQKLVDFLKNKTSHITSFTSFSSPSGIQSINLNEVLPTFISEKIKQGIEKFDKNMKGFLSDESIFYGVETRTSCPLRITRDPESLQSISHQGLYPAGEGAGYAGGITSAACDGVKIAEKIKLAITSK